MKRFRVFVSAVQGELAAERRAVKEAIDGDALLSEYFGVYLFEDSPAGGRPAERAYLAEVRRADVYIGILGMKYGRPGTGGVSPTEAEYRQAKECGKHILVFIKGKGAEDKDRDPGIQRMLKDVRDPKCGFCYKRFEDRDELAHAVDASLMEFLREQGIVGRGRFDEQICEDATLAEIDKAKVDWFTEQAKNKRNFPLRTGSPVRDVLTHLNLLRGGKLTNAAILLFGKRPKKFFLQAEVKCVQLPDTEVRKAFPSYKIFDDNLFEQVDKAVAFVMDTIRQAVVQQAHTPQFQRPIEIPVFAIQEAIVNAVAHRNYNTTSGVQVMVFTDRVEIWNSGGLPSELTVEDLKKPHTSYPANPLIANVLYLGDYIQKVGSGTLEMIRQCRTKGVPEPQFEMKRNLEFKTILPRDVLTEAALAKMTLNERQVKAIAYVKVHQRITNTDYQRITGATRKTAARDLDDLTRKGLLGRKGEKRGISYVMPSRIVLGQK